MPLKYNSHDRRPSPPSFVADLLAPLAGVDLLNPRRRQPVRLVNSNLTTDHPPAAGRTTALTELSSLTGPLTPRFGGALWSPRSRPALAAQSPAAACALTALAAQES
jgi:hypothetical protein